MKMTSALTFALAATLALGVAAGEQRLRPRRGDKQAVKEVLEAVKARVAKSPEGFKVTDPEVDREWRLKLVGARQSRVHRLGDDRFVACADFGSLDSRDVLDLDFYAVKDGTAWKIDQVLIHAVNGVVREGEGHGSRVNPPARKEVREDAEAPGAMKDFGSR